MLPLTSANNSTANSATAGRLTHSTATPTIRNQNFGQALTQQPSAINNLSQPTNAAVTNNSTTANNTAERNLEEQTQNLNALLDNWTETALPIAYTPQGQPDESAFSGNSLDLQPGEPLPPGLTSQVLSQHFTTDEISNGRKRPALPLTFSFGVRRPLNLAIALRHPVLDANTNLTPAQAVLNTLDLAATNRLPYLKGSSLNLFV